MKAAYLIVTCVLAAIPFLVPTAGANGLGFDADEMSELQGGPLLSLAALAWGMIGLRLIKT